MTDSKIKRGGAIQLKLMKEAKFDAHSLARKGLESRNWYKNLPFMDFSFCDMCKTRFHKKFLL